jgi:rare lipoprotein A (peptidoglycan hydrolase)
VNAGAAKRTVALAGVALIVALVSLALSSPRGHHAKHTLPQPASAWYSALAAPYNPARSRTRTACGQRLNAKTLGVAHPVLPCGVKLYISYRGTRVLTQVIDRGLAAPGREFYVTKALADRIGLHGTRSLRWTYAR